MSLRARMGEAISDRHAAGVLYSFENVALLGEE